VAGQDSKEDKAVMVVEYSFYLQSIILYQVILYPIIKEVKGVILEVMVGVHMVMDMVYILALILILLFTITLFQEMSTAVERRDMGSITLIVHLPLMPNLTGGVIKLGHIII